MLKTRKFRVWRSCASLILVFLMLPGSIVAQEVSAGKLIKHPHFSSKYVKPREVKVWLPDNHSIENTYSVLVMHDGQMLFDAKSSWNGQEWGVDETASRMITNKQVRPFIVVAIDNIGRARHSEYFPQKPLESLPAETVKALYNRERSPQQLLFESVVYSDNYLKFLVKELLPFVQSRYSVSQRREDTFLMGSSMGGLISIYALAEYPDVFGGAACLSTHWPGVFFEKDNPIPDAFINYLKDKLPEPGNHKIYFDHGTETLDAMYPELQEKVDVMMQERGYTAPLWQTRVFKGDAHDEMSWNKRLNIPIKFLLGSK